MAVLHDLQCGVDGCDQKVFDWLSSDAKPSCPTHPEAGPMEIWYHPKFYKPFEAFEYEEEGTGKTITISGMHQLREIEERSCKAFERGEGRPVIFRQFSQDKSNRDANVFQRLHPQRDRERVRTRNSRGIPYVTSVSGPQIPYDEED